MPGPRRSLEVAVCTFRRESLSATLRSIAAQDLPPDVELGVIVADNDDTPAARAAIEADAAALGLSLSYVHAPASNISIARNACLDAATADRLALIDDDEVAAPDWIARLLEGARATGAGVIFGPAVAVYPSDAPRWMRRGDFHSNRPTRRGRTVETGYCSNAILDRRDPRIRAARFDLAWGRTGGEDVDFFFRLHRAGVVMGAAPEAIVHEPVAPARMSLRWLLRRRRMTGAIYGHCALDAQVGERPARPRLMAGSALKAAYSALRAAAALGDRSRSAFWILRGAFHLGVLSGCVARPRRVNYGSE